MRRCSTQFRINFDRLFPIPASSAFASHASFSSSVIRKLISEVRFGFGCVFDFVSFGGGGGGGAGGGAAASSSGGGAAAAGGGRGG